MTNYIQVYLTTPTPEVARAITERLLADRLAACVQIAGPIESRYRWQGKLEVTQEWQCNVKTRLDLFSQLEAVVRSLHPYDVPEILAMPVTDGHDAYLAWLDHELAPANP